MKKIKVLIVDDEFLAINLLVEFLSRMDNFEVVGKAKTAIQAMSILQNEEIDLMFLDIQMPMLSGNNFLRNLRNPPLTIFTTAYSEYALEAFELNVVDYLLKPFSFERFLQAIQKAREKWLSVKQNAQILPPIETPLPEKSFLVIKSEGKMVKILYENILFVEGVKEYVKIVCANENYTTFERMKNIEEELPQDKFIRVHKSFIVAKEKAISLQTNMLEVGKYLIPVSRDKKEEVIAAIFGKK